GHEETIAEGAMKMLGQEDIFTKAAIEQSLSQAEAQIDQILEAGLPEAVRANLGMVGFRVVIDRQGNLVRLEQPTGPEEDY
ncbi:MAG: hypothetical protein ACLFWD_11380, partial [Anaerolineales bacterium]